MLGLKLNHVSKRGHKSLFQKPSNNKSKYLQHISTMLQPNVSAPFLANILSPYIAYLPAQPTIYDREF